MTHIDKANQIIESIRKNSHSMNRAKSNAGYALRRLRDMQSYLSAAQGFAAGECFVRDGLQEDARELEQKVLETSLIGELIGNVFGIDYSEYEA